MTAPPSDKVRSPAPTWVKLALDAPPAKVLGGWEPHRRKNWVLEGCCIDQCDGEVGRGDEPSGVGRQLRAMVEPLARELKARQQGEKTVVCPPPYLLSQPRRHREEQRTEQTLSECAQSPWRPTRADIVRRQPPPPTLPHGDVVRRPPSPTLPRDDVVRRLAPPTLPFDDVARRSAPPTLPCDGVVMSGG